MNNLGQELQQLRNSQVRGQELLQVANADLAELAAAAEELHVTFQDNVQYLSEAREAAVAAVRALEESAQGKLREMREATQAAHESMRAAQACTTRGQASLVECCKDGEPAAQSLQERLGQLKTMLPSACAERRTLLADGMRQLRAHSEELAATMDEASAALGELHEQLDALAAATVQASTEAAESMKVGRARMESGAALFQTHARSSAVQAQSSFDEHVNGALQSSLRGQAEEYEESVRTLRVGLKQAAEQLTNDGLRRAAASLQAAAAETEPYHRGIEALPTQVPQATGSVRQSVDRSLARLELLKGKD